MHRLSVRTPECCRIYGSRLPEDCRIWQSVAAFMHLDESMEDMEQKHWPMAGILSGKAFYTGKLGRFGYVELTAGQDQMLGRAGDCIRAHEFHYFDSSDMECTDMRSVTDASPWDGTVCRQEAAMRRDFHICIIIPTRSLH